MKFFLDRGHDINEKDDYGDTPLHTIAMFETNFAILQYFVENGGDVNARNNKGETPLHYAAFSQKRVEFLVSHGADIHARDNRGETALDHARHDPYSDDVADFLREQMGE